MIIGGSGDNLNNSATEYNFIQCRHDGLWNSDESKKYAPIPTNGNFTKLHVKLSAAPNGATKSYKFTIMKNGVAQTSTDLTFTDTETDKSTTFTLDLVPEDLVSIRCIPTNTPDIVDAKWCIVWEPDTTDEFIYLESAQEDPYDNVGEHRFISQGGAGGWNATEDNKATLMPTAGTWKKLAFKLRGGNLGVGETRTLTVRKGAYQTPYGWAATTLKVTISEGADSGIDNSNSFTVAKDDAVNMEATQTGTPLTGGRVSWGMVFVPTVAKEYPMFTMSNYTYTTQDLRYASIGQATTTAHTTTEADAIENFVTNEVDVTKLRVWFTATHGTSSIFVAVRDDGVDTNLDLDCISADNWEDTDTHTLAAGSEFAMKLDTDATPADRTINASCVFIDKSSGVVQVNKQTIIKHNLIEAINKPTIVKHNLIEAINKPTIIKHNIIEAILKQTIIKHNLIEAINKQTIIKHNIRTNILKQLILKHQIIEAILKQTIVKHNIIEAIRKSTIFKHNILNTIQVLKQTIIKHNIIEAIKKSTIVKHNIIESIPKQTIIKHQILEAINKQIIIKHNIIEAIGKNIIFKHQIIEGIKKSIIFKHSIIEAIRKSIIFKHNLGTLLSTRKKTIGLISARGTTAKTTKRGTTAKTTKRGTTAIIISDATIT